MTVHLWYKIEIAAGLGLPVTISNDVHSGSVTAEADVTVSMTDSACADTFEVCLVDLPRDLIELIKSTHAARPVNATVHLGYFDQPATRTGAGQVLTGRIMSVTSSGGDDGLGRTVLRGQEEGGYLLRTTPAEHGSVQSGQFAELAATLGKAAGVALAPGSTAGEIPAGFTVRAGSTLDALADIAARSDVPLVIRDRQILLGDAVGAPADRAPVTLDLDENLISLSTSVAEDTAPRPAFRRAPGAVRPVIRTTVDLTALGAPGFRVGQVAEIATNAGVATGPLRVSLVEHCFHRESGYTTRLRLISADRGERAQHTTELPGLADRLRDLVDRGRDDHPAIDMGEVSGHSPARHRVSLRYGQTPESRVAEPSVSSPIGSGADLTGKPIAAPFAFGKTGLLVPVYPRMRAVLAHNLGQVGDAMVTGFVWPDGDDRLSGKPGDYWLALPTGLGKNGMPDGGGANDLIDATGHRVVQVAGLRLAVGTKDLPAVGVRPDPPADDSITIEHQSGTTIKVDAGGAVTISTSGKPITLTDGSVSLKLGGSTVAVT